MKFYSKFYLGILIRSGEKGFKITRPVEKSFPTVREAKAYLKGLYKTDLAQKTMADSQKTLTIEKSPNRGYEVLSSGLWIGWGSTKKQAEEIALETAQSAGLIKEFKHQEKMKKLKKVRS